MKIIFVIILFILSNNCYSQARRDAIWCFGDSAQIDFNQQPPLVSWCATRSRGTACSIADSSGNLLFYCHTYYLPLLQAGYNKLGVVWNRNNEVMENGDSLVGGGWYYEMIIVPNPDYNNQYFLFHTGVTSNTQLYYSIIDLSFNNGLGKVIQKNTLVDSLSGNIITDGLSAMKHGNGRDWWLIFHTTGINPQNTFHKYLITINGIQQYPEQNIGYQTLHNGTRLKFNNIGNQLAIINTWGLIALFDFDRCSGNLSNYRLIHSEIISIENEFFSLEFSPNDSLLYISTGGNPTILYQFNLYSSNIFSSKVIIDSTSIPINAGGCLKIAIDGKIYLSKWWNDLTAFPFPYSDTTYNIYNTNLSVINQPNNLGSGCDYQSYSFNLGGKRTYVGLPNNPYYDMPALGGSICDTLGLPNGIRIPEKSAFTVFPNPARDKIYFSASNYLEEKPVVKIFDFTGKIVFEKQVMDNTIEVSKFSQGLYTISFFVKGVYHSSFKFTVLK
jgi:hypothetical protein